MSGRAGLEALEPAALEQLKAEIFQNMLTLKQSGGYHELLQPQFTLAQKL